VETQIVNCNTNWIARGNTRCYFGHTLS